MKINNVLLIVIVILLLVDKNQIQKNKTNSIELSINDSECKYYQEEYNKILNLYDIKENPKYNYIYSKVINRNMYNYYNELIITKGKKDDIEKNDAVINSEGLVGIVDKVYKNTSKVILLSNKKTTISVKINNTYGILKMDKSSNLIVESITNYDEIFIGDYIYTSGLGNLPANIYIGKVKSIEKTDSEIERRLIVENTINLDTLDYVAVIKGNDN